MTGRKYDQYCPIARALDVVGDRWALLIVRELAGGPRRYTDLHTDLPGVSTDILAARLKDLERDGVVMRRQLRTPAPAKVYELTPRGRRLGPVLTTLADWGADDLDEMSPTDSTRAHWFAVPLLRELRSVDFAGAVGEIDILLPEGTFHVQVAEDGLSYADGSAAAPLATVAVSAEARVAIARAAASLSECVDQGSVVIDGDDRLVGALKGW